MQRGPARDRVPEQTYAAGPVTSGYTNGDTVVLGDVNGDGKLDIVTANTAGTVAVLLNSGTGTFGSARTYALGGTASSVAVGDFNRDGRLDIATTGGTELDVLLNKGGGTFAAYQKVGPAGASVVAGDLDGDGFPDLAQIDGSGTSLDVLHNKADWPKT